MISVTCVDCGVQVITQRPTRKRCDSCGHLRDNAFKAAFERSPAGQASRQRKIAKDKELGRDKLYERRYAVSERGKETGRLKAARHRQRPGVRERDADSQRAYYATPQGRANRLAAAARRSRGISTENYRRLLVEVGNRTARCYMCGAVADEVDHVLPIAFAKRVGLEAEVDRYVAPICRPCHRNKTTDDIRLARTATEC